VSTTDTLSGLREQLESAAETLDSLWRNTANFAEKNRLGATADGVRLALSYLHDLQRDDGPPLLTVTLDAKNTAYVKFMHAGWEQEAVNDLVSAARSDYEEGLDE
jgi:hypothetical protein